MGSFGLQTWALALFLTPLPTSASLAASADAAARAGASSGDDILYTIRRGEHLFGIGKAFLIRPADYRVVQKLNRVADARIIPVGTVLRIPTRLLKTEPLTAQVSALRGTVRMTTGARALAPAIGMNLPQGSIVETGEDGFVTLTLPNGSKTSLPTRTRLRIDHLRRIILTGSVDYDLVVEAGKVETRAAPLGPNPNSRFRIRTPRAITAVRGTQFRVGYPDDASLTEVLEGKVAAGSAGAAAEDLTTGYGARVSPDGRLDKEALLAAPDLIAPGKVQVDPQVRLELAAMPQAREYRVSIATDASFTDVIADQRAATTLFAFDNIPNGSLFVRVSAVAASSLEGLSQTFAMRRVLTGLSASAAMDADTMRFNWGGDGEGRRLYHFQIMRNDKDSVPLVDEAALAEQGIALQRLDPGVYFWRVGVRQQSGDEVTENWLPFEKFTVSAPEQ